MAASSGLRGCCVDCPAPGPASAPSARDSGSSGSSGSSRAFTSL
eukprot:CAMPEP_0198425288 /NCGR_PEP_ID=MMETSP1452-20131203/4463_1 /TAXON_ID=1181717 /ORGANISM="Synchroma pusillum, Strain CCMP3072" /LENGTH=43 /DNA_ID= /DNA_START= /DNA_END= /DNA_ORIENTATION=